MNAVIEIRVVRKVVHPNPLNWFAVAEAGAHRLQIRAVSPDLFVTIHAGAGRWHAGRRRRLNRGMTVTAINAVVAHVVFVAELDRLLTFDPLSGVPSRTVDRSGHPQRRQQYKNGAEDSGPREIVRAVTKNLWHRVGQAFLPVWADVRSALPLNYIVILLSSTTLTDEFIFSSEGSGGSFPIL